MAAEGMNLTRAVPGTSLESTSATTYRGGEQNTFAPRPGRFLCPWARSQEPGYFCGGNKFDLDRWDDAFFQRLKDFVARASERGIIVEFNLFYVLYGDGPEFGKWNLHPLNARNNINNVGHVPFHRYNTLDEPALVARHGRERLRAAVEDRAAQGARRQLDLPQQRHPDVARAQERRGGECRGLLTLPCRRP